MVSMCVAVCMCGGVGKSIGVGGWMKKEEACVVYWEGDRRKVGLRGPNRRDAGLECDGLLARIFW